MTTRKRNPPDPRHVEFRDLLDLYWRMEGNELVPDLPWGAAEAGALGAFLRANPRLGNAGFNRLLQHRLDSDDHARGEPPRVWLSSITRYANGPLNQYKLPKKGGQDGNRADQRNRNIADATSAALQRLRGLAGD